MSILINSNSIKRIIFALDQKLNYIHENAVRAGIVENPEDYLYSSARDFAGKDCMLKIVQMIMPTEKIPLMRTVK